MTTGCAKQAWAWSAMLVVAVSVVVLWLAARRDGAATGALESPRAPQAAATRAVEPGERAAPTVASLEPADSSREPFAPGPVPSGTTVEAHLPLTVHTRSSMIPNAASVGDVEFAVIVGPMRGPDARELARARTDANGDALVAVPWHEVAMAQTDPQARLGVRVIGAGFQQRTQAMRVPAEPTPQELTVLGVAGGTLVGRLLGIDGTPHAGTVRAVALEPDVRAVSAGVDVFGPRGWFELHLILPGVYDLTADTPDGAGGTASLRGLTVSFTYPAQRIELVLAGNGALRGRVVDVEGAPAAALTLIARAVELGDGTDDSDAMRSVRDAFTRDGRGRAESEVRTAADGSFELRGLRAGRFRIFASVDEGFGIGHVLTPEPVDSAPGPPLELVFSRPHLAVRIVEPDGTPWSGSAALGTPSRWGSTVAWPKEPTLIVAPPPDDASYDARGLACLRGQVVDGVYVFECEAQRTYQVGLIGGGQPWRPLDVLVPAHASRVEVVVTRAPAAELGTWLVRARDAESEARGLAVRCSIEDSTTGFALLREWGHAVQPWRFELPAGEYRVAVEGEAELDLYHGVLTEERVLGRVEKLARVVAGRESTIELSLGAGARLRLTLRGATSDADRAAVSKPGWRYFDSVEDRASVAEIALFAPNRRPEPVWFRWELDGTSAAGTHLRATLALGESELSEVVSAGRFELVARLPGGRVARAPVELVDGRTADVELVFD
ncbi:MAG: hypothetical protein IT453_14515 [Planctomycetes bacterium]|nr:hypothetical protein [Planctomycetota bacterium]